MSNSQLCVNIYTSKFPKNSQQEPSNNTSPNMKQLIKISSKNSPNNSQKISKNSITRQISKYAEKLKLLSENCPRWVIKKELFKKLKITDKEKQKIWDQKTQQDRQDKVRESFEKQKDAFIFKIKASEMKPSEKEAIIKVNHSSTSDHKIKPEKGSEQAGKFT